VFIHAFTDGRDTDPKSGYEFVQKVENHLSNSVGKIASVSGRYYAMDRDKRWERIQLAYNSLVKGEGPTANNALGKPFNPIMKRTLRMNLLNLQSLLKMDNPLLRFKKEMQ
jgi:bisphosphoglycerate-independent phosphoglycerate mutase (AlkP superfamily)